MSAPDRTVFVTDETTSQLTMWLIRRLAPHARPDEKGVFWFELSKGELQAAGGTSRVGVAPYGHGADALPEPPCDEAPSETLFDLLVRRLYDSGHITTAVPSNQLSGVHDLADRLYAAYRVDGGTAHLAGCTLEDRLIAKFTLSNTIGDPASVPATTERVTDCEGNVLDERTLATLGLDKLTEASGDGQPTWRQLARIVAAGLTHAEEVPQHAATDAAHRDAPANRSPAAGAGAVAGDDSFCDRLEKITLIQCKYAEGKLCFTIGEASAEVTFTGWAQSLEPPPIVCPHTGSATFHLAATDDGRIAAAEEIAACEQTGRRLLKRELARCSVTGKVVVPELTEICPVSGKRTLRDAMRTCATCRQHVSPKALVGDRCAACRGPVKMTIADPRLVRIFDEHPGLESWRAWRMSETSAVYVLVASGWFERLLVVVDRDSLEPLRVARSTRFRRDWETIASERWKDFLE